MHRQRRCWPRQEDISAVRDDASPRPAPATVRGWWQAPSCAARDLMIASASLAAAPIRCSQLSSTISACLSRSHVVSPATALAAGRAIPRTLSTVSGTSSGSCSEASPAYHTPSANTAREASATAPATLVFPIPPGPTMVAHRRRRVSSASSAITASRPTILVSETGMPLPRGPSPLTGSAADRSTSSCFSVRRKRIRGPARSR